MTATGNEAVTLTQLRIATGSTGGGGVSATGGEAVTIAQAAQALRATPTGTPDVGGRAIRLSQLKTAVGAFPSVEIVPWSTGSDEQIAAMVAAADAGQIDLSVYWSEGDTRTVSLSSMSATGVGERHVAQSVQFVLSDPGHFTLASGKPCNFVVNMKDCLREQGYMNPSPTNSGGWNGCKRRTWCNNVFRNAIPSGLRPAFKQFKTKAATGPGTASTTSTDWFALPSEVEVFGRASFANSSAESGNTQLNYYKARSNRVKKVKGSAKWWWVRSPYNGASNLFCMVVSSGSVDASWASNDSGLSPFGCI